MEGSAIARNSSKKSFGSNLRGQGEHPASQEKLKGNTQPQPGLGRDNFTSSNPRGGVGIKSTL